MSIINDALKKTQESLSNQKDKGILKKPAIQNEGLTGIETQQKINAPSQTRIMLAFLFAGLLTIIIILLTLQQNSKKDPHLKNTKNITSSENAEAEKPSQGLNRYLRIFQSEQKSAEETHPHKTTVITEDGKNKLILDGIMFIEDKNIAMINGNPYEEGETIYGMKIIKILPESVEIQTNGTKTISLNIKEK